MNQRFSESFKHVVYQYKKETQQVKYFLVSTSICQLICQLNVKRRSIYKIFNNEFSVENLILHLILGKNIHENPRNIDI